MRKENKRFLIAFLICSILMVTTPAFADSIMQKIDVILNGVNVAVDGKEIETNTILYNGVVFVPIRTVSEIFDKDIEWNQEDMTVNIKDKVIAYEIDRYKYLNRNNKIYYDINYIKDVLQEYGNYLLFGYGDGENIKMSLISDDNILIEYIPYYLYNDEAYISEDYLSVSILPLLK